MSSPASELRHAVRRLARRPGFTVAAVGLLASAFAIHLAARSLSAAILGGDVVARDPDRLVTAPAAVSMPDVPELAERLSSLAGLAAFSDANLALDRGEGAEQVAAEIVSADYFDVLGVAAERGRVFGPDDAADPHVALLGHGAWLRRFGGDPGVVGRSVRLNNAAFTILGVLPRGFLGVEPASAPELWVPLASHAVTLPGWDVRDNRQERWLRLVGRLGDGVALERAQDEARAAAAEFSSRYPESWRGTEIALTPVAATAAALRERLGPVLQALRAGTAGLLVIACASVALLVLAGHVARRRELAVRAALGASRGRIAAHLLLEGAIVAAAAAATALLAAPALSRLAARLLPELALLDLPLGIGGRLVFGVLAAGAIATVLFGLLPALGTLRRDAASALVHRGALHGRPRRRLRAGLLALEVALTLVLLAGAGLFARTLRATSAVDPGFEPAGTTIALVNTTTAQWDRARAARTLGEALDGLRRAPGVTSAAGAFLVPLGFGDIRRPVVRAGEPAAEDEPAIAYNVVTDGWFETLRLPLEGRDFGPQDRDGAMPAIIVSRALAARLWPGESALGRRVQLPLREPGPEYEVVGVAGDLKHVALEDEAQPFFYLPWTQSFRGRLAFVVRGDDGAAPAAAALRAALRGVDRDLPLHRILAYEDYVRQRLARPRALAALVTTLAGLALALAAAGLWGVVSQAASERRREVALRIALGARPAEAMRAVSREGLAPAILGAALGFGASLALAPFVSGVLYGVTPLDPLTHLGAAALLVAVAAAASVIPAFAAARRDPWQVLRED